MYKENKMESLYRNEKRKRKRNAVKCNKKQEWKEEKSLNYKKKKWKPVKWKMKRELAWLRHKGGWKRLGISEEGRKEGKKWALGIIHHIRNSLGAAATTERGNLHLLKGSNRAKSNKNMPIRDRERFTLRFLRGPRTHSLQIPTFIQPWVRGVLALPCFAITAFTFFLGQWEASQRAGRELKGIGNSFVI